MEALPTKCTPRHNAIDFGDEGKLLGHIRKMHHKDVVRAGPFTCDSCGKSRRMIQPGANSSSLVMT